jgi:hypothetical protein
LLAVAAVTCCAGPGFQNPDSRSSERGAAWSPDGSTIVIASRSPAELKLIDAKTLDVQRSVKDRVRGWGGTPTGIAWRLAGDELVTAGFSGGIRVWRASDLVELRSFAESDGTCALALSPDGRRVLASGAGVATRIWDFSSGDITAELVPAPSRITAVAISPDSRLAATADKLGTVRIWDVESLQPIAALEGVTHCPKDQERFCQYVEVLGFASDSASVVWNVGTEVLQWHFLREAELLARTLQGNRLLAAQRVALAEREGVLRRFGERVEEPAYGDGYPRLALAADGSRIAMRRDPTRMLGLPHVVVYDVGSGSQISRFDAEGSFLLLNGNGSLLLQAMRFDWSILLPSISNYHLYDANTGAKIR